MKLSPTSILNYSKVVLLIGFIVISGCKKTPSDDPIAAKSIIPTGLSASSSINSNVVSISLTWDASTDASVTSYKLYRGIGTTPALLITTLSKDKTTYIDSVGLLPNTEYKYSISSFNSASVESVRSAEVKVTSPDMVLKNQFDLKGVMNMAVLNKTIAGTNTNITATDDKGNVLELKIPDAKSFTLNVSSVKRLNTKYLYVNGILSIVYKNDKKATYNNFIIDTETGSFYRLSADLGFIVTMGLRGNFWINGQIQYDAKNVIYVHSKSDQFVQEISQVVLASATDTTMTATITKFNIIGQNDGFNFSVLRNGDIIYKYRPSPIDVEWYYRSSAGKTSRLTDLISREPLVLNNVRHFDKVYTDQTFFINDSQGTPLFFVTGALGASTSNSPIVVNPFLPANNEFIKIFTFESDGQGGVRLTHFKNTKFNSNRMPQTYVNENYLLYPAHSSKWYFTKDKKHVFTHAGSSGRESIWWLYDEETNSIKDTYIPYQSQTFSTYSSLLTQSPNYAFFPLKNDFYRVDLSNLEWRKTTNANYQIYKTSYIGEEKVQFYGVSYLTGNKVLGEILNDGSVKILKEFPVDVEVRELVRIGVL